MHSAESLRLPLLGHGVRHGSSEQRADAFGLFTPITRGVELLQLASTAEDNAVVVGPSGFLKSFFRH
jgi:hypothetical protein